MKKKHSRGNVTVFLCILMSVLVPTVCVLTDLVRWRVAQGQVREALRLTSDSLLARYDRPLREEYGLMALSATEKTVLDGDALLLMEANLLPPPDSGVMDLYGFEIAEIEVVPLYNLSESQVLSRQMAEFMKYRAPVSFARGLLAKLRVFQGSTAETAAIEAGMAHDREMAAIRKELVRLSQLFNIRLSMLGTDPVRNVADWSEEMAKVMGENLTLVSSHANAYEQGTGVLSTLHSEMRVMSRRLQHAREELETANRLMAYAEAAVTAAKAEVVEEDSDGEAESVTIPVTEEILRLEAAYVAAASGALLAATTEKRLHQQWLDKLEHEWRPLAKQVQIDLDALCDGLASVGTALEALEAHLDCHHETAKQAQRLTEYLMQRSETIAGSVSHLEDLAGKAGETGGALRSTTASRPVMPDVAELDLMKRRLAEIQMKLADWSLATSSRERKIIGMMRDAEGAALRLATIVDRPGDELGGCIPALPANLVEGLAMDADCDWIEGFSTAARMRQKGILFVPSLQVSPPVTEPEREDFLVWCQGWCPHTDPGSVTSGTDAAQRKEAERTMKSLRGAAAETARTVSTGGTGNKNRTPAFDEVVAAGLPSGVNGSSTSAVALAEIGRMLQQMEDEGGMYPPLLHVERGDPVVDEHGENLFTRGLSQVVETGTRLGDLLSGSPEALMRNLYSNEYLLSSFKHAALQNGVIPNEISWGRNTSRTVFSKGEVEYILFGSPVEETNLLAVRGMVFSIRLAMNLQHVHTSPEKKAATLALATALAGWTVFGVPVVHQFLCLAWAAAESIVDVNQLMNGESVPLLKTTSTWSLSPAGFRTELVQKMLLNPARTEVAKVVGSGINLADEAVRESVGSWLDGAVDSAFAPLEAQCEAVGNQASEAMEVTTSELPQVVVQSIREWVASLPEAKDATALAEKFEPALNGWMEGFRQTLIQVIPVESARQLEAIRQAVKRELRASVFGSVFYQTLLEQTRKGAAGFLDAGFDVLSDEADELLGKGTTVKGMNTGIAGRMLSMDYREFLFLFLMLMPESVKIGRAADLIQLNLSRMVPSAAIPLQQLQTAVFVRTTVWMDFWFLPEKRLRESGFGIIHASWGQAY